MTPSERKALDDYVAAVRQHYGERLVDVLLFGSRARGDYHPDSDLDLAVILEDGDWSVWDETWFLSGLAYDALIDEGLHIQPLPVRRSAWEEPALHHNPHLINAMRGDARSLEDVSERVVEGGREKGETMTPTERKALDDYVATVRNHYGSRLVDILVFGSRARGDHRADSEVDLAVILEDGDWRLWDEKRLLTDLAYDALLEPGLWIQAWPASRSEWKEEDLHKVPFFVIGARPDARPVSEAR